MRRVLEGMLVSVAWIAILIGGRIVLGLLLKPAPPVLTAEQEAQRARALELHRDAVVVDVYHVSDGTFWDVLDVTQAPIIASHSNVRAMADHPRNLTDDMIRALAANEGVVMVKFMTAYLDPEKTPEWKLYSGWHWFTHPRQTGTPLSVFVDHIDHVVRVAGIDHVGLGSDFDGVPCLPTDLKDVGDLPNITVELMRRGYSEEEIYKILGGNALRVLAAVEGAAGEP